MWKIQTASTTMYLLPGFNPNNSIDKYFLSYANGVTLDDIEVYDGENVTEVYRWLGENRGYGAQQAFLAYQGLIS